MSRLPKAPSPSRRRQPIEPRAWQRMLSGRRLDLLDPSPLDVEIEDIAHGLARVARWNGQTTGNHAFSVAEHSVVVTDLCEQLSGSLPAKWRLAALLHDAPEYVIGDMISPFKAALGDGYKAIETRLARAIHLRFELPAIIPADIRKLIKTADHICAWFEATQLAGFSEAESDTFFGRPPDSVSLELAPLPTPEAQALFLSRYSSLIAELDG